MLEDIKLKTYKHQHFLNNPTILKKEITLAKLKPTDKVIEIGAGDGRLSKLISPHVKLLTSYELDPQFKNILKSLNLKNVNFIEGNALKFSWRDYNKIVSNIPYSLSEPIIQKAIQENIQELTMITGKKFALLLKDKSTKIGIITNLYFKIYLIEEIKKDEFTPPPRVNSYLIHLKRKKPTELEIVLQALLEKKSKTKNALMYTLVNLGKTKKQSKEIIKNMNLKSLEKPIKTTSAKIIENIKKELKKFL